MSRPIRLLLAGTTAALAVAALLVYLAYRSDLAAARARIASGSGIAQTRCGPIEYAEAGQGPAVLLIHGAGGGFDQTAEAGREIAARGYRVISPSRFGYLRTPQPADATPAAQADAHACLLDALGIARAAIVAVSAGSPSAMQFALRHPQRCGALVLLAPLAYSPRAAERLRRPAADSLLERAVDSDFVYWLLTRLPPSVGVQGVLGIPSQRYEAAEAAERGRIDRLLRQPLPISERREGMLNDLTVATRLPRYELERIVSPTLLVSAPDDLYGTFESARYMAAHIRGARLLALPDGGHLWVGHHRQVLDAVSDFLRLAGGAPPATPRAGE